MLLFSFSEKIYSCKVCGVTSNSRNNMIRGAICNPCYKWHKRDPALGKEPCQNKGKYGNIFLFTDYFTNTLLQIWDMQIKCFGLNLCPKNLFLNRSTVYLVIPCRFNENYIFGFG